MNYNFYNNNFEARFCQLAHFTRKLVLSLNDRFWLCVMRYEHCMVFLELVGTIYRTFDEDSINSV